MTMALMGKHIAILATNGFEQSELEKPLEGLQGHGAQVDIVSPESGKILGWDEDSWGDKFNVDVDLAQAHVDKYHALVLPGGLFNPDSLRQNQAAIEFIRAVAANQVPVAAICHAPWLLIEAGLVAGKTVTSFPSIKTDLTNAGASWVDQQVVTDGQLITSRKPDDLEAFIDTITSAVSAR